MAKTSLLGEMKANPGKGWSINDCETLCSQCGVRLMAPTRGSHYKVSSERLPSVIVVPYNRPIKRVYIRKLVAFCEAHANAPVNKKGPK